LDKSFDVETNGAHMWLPRDPLAETLACASIFRIGSWTERRGFAYRRGPDVFAKGAIRHPDHATVVLRGWHQVAMNIERIT
jgi:hypothetical protein